MLSTCVLASEYLCKYETFLRIATNTGQHDLTIDVKYQVKGMSNTL